MDHHEALETAVEALRAIAKFGHAPDCYGCAPVHECGCYDKSEKDIARAALVEMGLEDERLPTDDDNLSMRHNIRDYRNGRR